MLIVVENKVNWAEENLEIESGIEYKCNINGLFLKYTMNYEPSWGE